MNLLRFKPDSFAGEMGLFPFHGQVQVTTPHGRKGLLGYQHVGFIE
jgi:hypothetical protein